MKLAIGNYLETDSIIHRLNPVVKLIIFFTWIIAIFMVKNLAVYVGILIGIIILIRITKLPLKLIVDSATSLKWLLAIMIVFNLFFYKQGNLLWEFGIIQIYDQGVYQVTLLTFRLISVVMLATMLTLTTKPLDLTLAIEKLLSPFKRFIPVADIALMVSIAIRFIPTLIDETDKIMKAQASRGANIEEGPIYQRVKHLLSMLIPMFVISFKRAENLAVAMEARGYTDAQSRTRLTQLNWYRFDTIGLIIGLIITVILVVIGWVG
ncbi:MAG: energy-coupling factor transporter transmembrane component T family protein [Culicoidibacterales bacterium]